MYYTPLRPFVRHGERVVIHTRVGIRNYELGIRNGSRDTIYIWRIFPTRKHFSLISFFRSRALRAEKKAHTYARHAEVPYPYILPRVLYAKNSCRKTDTLPQAEHAHHAVKRVLSTPLFRPSPTGIRRYAMQSITSNIGERAA